MKPPIEIKYMHPKAEWFEPLPEQGINDKTCNGYALASMLMQGVIDAVDKPTNAAQDLLLRAKPELDAAYILRECASQKDEKLIFDAIEWMAFALEKRIGQAFHDVQESQDSTLIDEEITDEDAADEMILFLANALIYSVSNMTRIIMELQTPGYKVPEDREDGAFEHSVFVHLATALRLSLETPESAELALERVMGAFRIVKDFEGESDEN